METAAEFVCVFHTVFFCISQFNFCFLSIVTSIELQMRGAAEFVHSYSQLNEKLALIE